MEAAGADAREQHPPGVSLDDSLTLCTTSAAAATVLAEVAAGMTLVPFSGVASATGPEPRMTVATAVALKEATATAAPGGGGTGGMMVEATWEGGACLVVSCPAPMVLASAIRRRVLSSR
jgi:hypothetical protein